MKFNGTQILVEPTVDVLSNLKVGDTVISKFTGAVEYIGMGYVKYAVGETAKTPSDIVGVYVEKEDFNPDKHIDITDRYIRALNVIREYNLEVRGTHEIALGIDTTLVIQLLQLQGYVVSYNDNSKTIIVRK